MLYIFELHFLKLWTVSVKYILCAYPWDYETFSGIDAENDSVFDETLWGR
jgi:hypothetical protein